MVGVELGISTVSLPIISLCLETYWAGIFQGAERESERREAAGCRFDRRRLGVFRIGNGMEDGRDFGAELRPGRLWEL